MAIFIAIPAVIVVLAIVGATSFNRYVVRQDAGSPRMKELQQYIRRGAYTFMVEESKVMGIAMLIVGAVLWILFSWDIAVAFWVGSLFAMSAGFIGMNAATHANVRTANAAKRSFKEALNIAFSGGSVMGLAVAGLALGGLLLVFLLFHSTLDPETIHIETRYLFGLEGAGVNFIRIALLISAYSMGASLVALFDRVGGGVYTKAADMAADLVGKVEEGIPEDDPRNPATIADNVGDNVGDVAGLGADLLESFVGAIISIIIISAYIFVGRDNPPLQPLLAQLGLADGIYGSTYWWFIFLPVLIVAGGIVACFCGILYIRFNRRPEEKQPTVLMNGTRIAAFFTVLTTFFITWFSPLSMMPFYAVLLGIVAGVAIGFFSEYYTSAKYKSVQMLAKVNQTGPAIGVTEGMAIGMLSTFLPIIVIAAAILISYHIGGLIGIAYGALGMLSFVAMTVAVDSYGPIADNAGGIATMAKMDPEIRNRTDRLDSIGNTTAAIGKGFAIGSAVFASLGLIAAYLWAAIDRAELVLPPQLPLIGQIAADLSPTGYPVEVAAFVLGGLILGAMIPYVFSSLLIRAVGRTANTLVMEIRRQFSSNPKILSGDETPDYQRCISITAHGGLRQMVLPSIMAVVTPIIFGLIFGRYALGGFLVGALVSCAQLALYCANSGGAMDNAKKYIEEGHYGGPGSEAHAASVIGDTVGDPLKDTVGPSLDILTKLMSVIALVFASLFPITPIFMW